jgi:hypothetical protein
MTITHARRRLTAALCATLLGGALFALSGGPADAAALPFSDIIPSGSSAIWSPAGIEATLSVPAQCAGYHAAFYIQNLTLTTHVVEYYGGDVTLTTGETHIFCIGGDANAYRIEYALIGTRSVLEVYVP